MIPAVTQNPNHLTSQARQTPLPHPLIKLLRYLSGWLVLSSAT